MTEPIWAVPAASAGREASDTACVAGKFPMVTLLPTVTDEMLTGTVPEIDAVTLPICAVPAAKAGSELTVTVVDVSETGCVA